MGGQRMGIFLHLAASLLSVPYMMALMRSILCLALLAVATGLSAQGGPPVGGPPPCWPPPCIPIDGGLGFLLAAGAIFGGKKALDLRRSTGRAA